MIRRAILALVALGTFVTLCGQTGVSSADPADSSLGSGGSDYLATCLQSAHGLSALFLYDKSGSLASSDPNGIRYEGLRIALQSLASIERGDDVPVTIEAAVSAFDDGYEQADTIVDWTTLNAGDDSDTDESIDAIVAAAEAKTAPTGGTNFTAAMEGAWSDIQDRGSHGTCRVVFWFTDGEDEVNTVGTEPCRADVGLIDQMRRAGVVVIGLQLGPPTDDLRAIATGDSGSAQCGRNPIPPDSATGVYIQAADSAALRRLFGSLGNLVRGCTPQGDRGGHVDPGIRSMNVTINTPSLVSAVRLDAPDGTVISAAPQGSTTQNGYSALAQSDASYASVLVDFPPGRGAGSWVVSVGQATAPADMEFCVFSGLHLERIDPRSTPTAGGPAEILYHAVDTAGNEGDLSDYKDVALGAAAVASNGEIRKATAYRDGNRIVVRIDTLSTDARLQVRVTAQPTTVSDLLLTPLAVDEGVGFTLSQAFPSISPVDHLDLGTAVRRNPAAGVLTLIGSPLGPAKACLEQPRALMVPDDQTGASLSAPSGCIDLARGESRTVEISVSPTEPTVGNGEAALPMKLIAVAGSEMDGQAATVELPVLWRYENPRDPLVFWIVGILTAMASVGLPLLALGLASWLTARFEVDGLRGEVIPVVVGPEGPRRVQPLEGSPDSVLDLYQMSVIPTAGRRRFTVGPVELVSTGRLSPFKAPSFSVRPLADRHRVVSSVPPPTTDGATAAASPGLGFLAAVVVSESDLADPNIRDVPAILVVLLRDRKVSSAQLDPLMNGKIDWALITDRWRSGVDIRATTDRDRISQQRDYTHLDRPLDDPPDSRSYSHLDRDDS